MLLALTLLLTATDPQVAALDEAWLRRDQPQEAAALQALVDSFVTSEDYEKLWRASRWYAWRAGPKTIPLEKKGKLAKLGWELGEHAEKLNSKGIEAKYWTAINVGFYATTIPVLQAMTLGIERKFRDLLIAVAKSNADHLSFGVEYVGPEMALGSYYYKMPWPKQDKGKSREWFAKALQGRPDDVRAHYLYADTLVGDGNNAEARKELQRVLDGSEAYDPPDARRNKQFARGAPGHAQVGTGRGLSPKGLSPLFSEWRKWVTYALRDWMDAQRG